MSSPREVFGGRGTRWRFLRLGSNYRITAWRCLPLDERGEANMAKRSKEDVARAREMVRRRIEISADAWTFCDQLIERELQRLASHNIMPTCSRGCAHCCRQEIRVARAEAEAAAQWIAETWTETAITGLKHRLRGWIAWYTEDYSRLLKNGISRNDAFYEHGPQCPLLENNECSIYPVRPMTCRRHYVTSPPDACRQLSDPLFPGEGLTVPMESVVHASAPARDRIQGRIEATGSDYFRTAHLLPEWLLHLLHVEEQPWLRTPPLFEF